MKCDYGTEGCAKHHLDDVATRGPLIVMGPHGHPAIMPEGCANDRGYCVCTCSSRPDHRCGIHPDREMPKEE